MSYYYESPTLTFRNADHRVRSLFTAALKEISYDFGDYQHSDNRYEFWGQFKNDCLGEVIERFGKYIEDSEPWFYDGDVMGFSRVKCGVVQSCEVAPDGNWGELPDGCKEAAMLLQSGETLSDLEGL